MNKNKIIGYAILVVIALSVFYRAATGGMEHPFQSSRTFGIWLAALLTLAIMSFLYNDNPFYRFAEHLFIGVSAAYWMVLGFWAVIVPNLWGRLDPEFVKKHFIPDLPIDDYYKVWYWVPLVLGILLLMRLSPKGGWISRWPLAFIFGTTAGLRFVGYLDSDFISQIKNSIVSIVVLDGGSAWQIFQHSFSVVVSITGVITGLIYFFFSKEHKGLFGKAARVGIWVLMVTFGAGFGYTVMGRVALLVGRMEFLFRDWLNIVK
jgi:hypothetical protein